MEKQKIINEIEKLNNKISEYSDELEEIEKNEYAYLLNNYYKLSATCCIYIKEIDYVTDSYIHVIGITIYSDEKKSFNIESEGTESISVTGKPTEITKQHFIDFLNKGIENINNIIKI